MKETLVNLLNEWISIIEKTEVSDYEAASQLAAAMTEEIEQCDAAQRTELRAELLSMMLDMVAYVYEGGYEDLAEIRKLPIVQFLIQESQELGSSYFLAVSCFFQGKYDACEKLLKRYIQEETEPIDEHWFALHFLPFKNAYPGFWEAVHAMLEKANVDPVILTFCRASELYFCTKDMTELEKCLTSVLQCNPDSVLANELLGICCYTKKRWYNAIACFEKLSYTELLSEADLHFYLAWANERIQYTEQAIQYYQKCLDVDENYSFAANNLGYAYYRTKQYQKAEKILAECIAKGQDLNYTVNNYMRTLLAMGDYAKAENFAENAPAKIQKALLEKLKREKQGGKPAELSAFEEEPVYAAPAKKLPAQKMEQFSSERLLEEELEERMNRGMPVFGMQLKMYRRKGIYGRQFIIPEGRLDLLAEDAQGNLYIIELKKDSGYDDAYEQTVRYLESPTMQKLAGEKRLQAIVCLNAPMEKLIDDVRHDPRVRLFTYQISYTEIK